MKLDKQEVRKPDVFLRLSEHVSHWASKNRGLVIGVFAALVVGGAGYGIYDIYSTNRENKAQEALYQARKKYNPAVAEPFAQKPTEPKLNDESVKSFESVITEFKGTQASKVAAIELSQAFLDERKFEPALKVFDKSSPASTGDLVASLHILQNAKVLEANGKCNEAISLLEKLWQSQHTLKALQTEARVRAGICYEQLSQLDKAKEMFTTASQEKGAAADTAKKYLRLIQPNAG